MAVCTSLYPSICVWRIAIHRCMHVTKCCIQYLHALIFITSNVYVLNVSKFVFHSLHFVTTKAFTQIVFAYSVKYVL